MDEYSLDALNEIYNVVKEWRDDIDLDCRVADLVNDFSEQIWDLMMEGEE